MEEKTRDHLARERADEYAPHPTGGLGMAGVLGAGLVLGAVAVVCGFYGWKLQDHLLMLLGLMAVGFGVALIVYTRLAKKNRRARKAERARIDGDEDAR